MFSKHTNGSIDRIKIQMALLSSLGVGFWGNTLNADVVTSFYDNDLHYSYHVTHMPDIDQVRSGLLGNGQMHCVPAASVNLLLYAANHGFEDLGPGPGNWQSQATYPPVTNFVSVMGNLMQTTFVAGNPNANPPIPNGGGTNGENADAGLSQWLAPYDSLVMSSHLTAPQYAVNLNNVAKSLIFGNIGAMSYGRYDVVGTGPGNIPIVNRSSGHATTIVRAYRNGNDMQLWVRDPADNNDSQFAQSQFTNRVFSVNEIQVYLQDDNQPPGMELRVMPRLDDGSDTGQKIRLMDGFRAIRPKTGYSFSPSQQSLGVNMPIGFGGIQPTQVIPSPFGPILGVTFHPQLQDFLLIAGAKSPELFRLNPLSGEGTPVNLPSPPAFVKTIGNGDTYVITLDNLLHRLTPELAIDASVTLQHDTVADESISFSFTKIEFDPGSATARPASVVIATMIDRKVMFYPTDLSTPVIRDLPSFLNGELLDFAIEPATGRAWFCMSSSNSLFGILWNATGVPQIETLSMPTIIAPTGLDFDDAGNLHVCANGQLNVLERIAGGGWAVDANSPLQGGTCEGEFAMMRNNTNYDPSYHNTPSWNANTPLEELVFGEAVPDCTPDVVFNNAVDVDDLLAVINAWGTCEGFCPADIVADDAINVDDLLAVINAWGACP